MNTFVYIGSDVSLKFEQFGKYLLLEKLATGGMAEVFLARTLAAGGITKFVAIKRILPQYAESPEFIDMFKDEAKIAVNLNHSNVVSIYDFGVESNQFYLVMDFVDGRNLRQILNKLKKTQARMSIDQVVYIIKEVSSGLDNAHRCLDARTGKPLNITHRDMSPQNVMVSFEGEVKIVDFGIAKAESQLETTRAGTLKGKFGYMSPEQAEGHAVDLRTDIFSLGIVLWELLANDRLFVASSELNTLRKIRDCQIPSLRKLNPNISSELERITMKALARDRNLRYQTSAAMHRDLNRFLNRHYPEFSPQDFATFIKQQFSDEIFASRQKQIEYARINATSPGEISVTTNNPQPNSSSNPMLNPNTNSFVSANPQSGSVTKPPPEQSAHNPSSNSSFSFSVQTGSNPLASDAPTPSPQIPARPLGNEEPTGMSNSILPAKPMINETDLARELNRVRLTPTSQYGQQTEDFSQPSIKSQVRSMTRSGVYDRNARPPYVKHLIFGGIALVLALSGYTYMAKFHTEKMSKWITRLDPYIRPFHLLVGISDGQSTASSQVPVDAITPEVVPAPAPRPQPTISAQPSPPPDVRVSPPAISRVIPVESVKGTRPPETYEDQEPLRPGEPRDTILITSTPSGAEILVNGRPTGSLTPSRVEVPSKRNFSITLRRMGFLDYYRGSLNRSTQTSRFSGTLQPAMVGYLDIDVVPPQNVRVYVNGRQLKGEHLPILGYAVPAETSITVRAEDPVAQQSAQQVIKVPKDRRMQVILDMRRGGPKNDRQPSRSR